MSNHQKELSDNQLDEIFMEISLDNIDDEREGIFFTFDVDDCEASDVENKCTFPLTYL